MSTFELLENRIRDLEREMQRKDEADRALRDGWKAWIDAPWTPGRSMKDQREDETRRTETFKELLERWLESREPTKQAM